MRPYFARFAEFHDWNPDEPTMVIKFDEFDEYGIYFLFFKRKVELNSVYKSIRIIEGQILSARIIKYWQHHTIHNIYYLLTRKLL